MNRLLQNKFFNSLVILLMIANIITIGLFWWNSYHHPPHRIGMERNIGPADFIPTELKMTDMQIQQWAQLKEEHKASVPLLRKNIEQAKDDFFKLVKTEMPSDSAINSAWETVNIAEKAIHTNTLLHFNAIRKICTPEQKKRFDEIIEQAIKGMGREGRPGDPRRFSPSLPSNE